MKTIIALAIIALLVGCEDTRTSDQKQTEAQERGQKPDQGDAKITKQASSNCWR